MEKNKIVDHICDILKSSTIENDPWPHRFIEGIFPNNFYKEILYNFPSSKEFSRRVDQNALAKAQNYSPQRYTLNLNKWLIDELYNIVYKLIKDFNKKSE